MEGKWHPSIPQHLVTVLTVAGDEVGPVTGAATGCYCQQVATILSAHDNPLLCNSFSRKRLPMSCQPPLILSILSSSLWTRPPEALPWPPSCPWYWPELSSWPSDDPGTRANLSWIMSSNDFPPLSRPCFPSELIANDNIRKGRMEIPQTICTLDLRFKSLSHWYMLKNRGMFVGERSCIVK